VCAKVLVPTTSGSKFSVSSLLEGERRTVSLAVQCLAGTFDLRRSTLVNFTADSTSSSTSIQSSWRVDDDLERVTNGLSFSSLISMPRARRFTRGRLGDEVSVFC